MTMIERVATAIEECGPVGCEVLGRKQALEMARAAIQAMRQPTEAMLDSGVAFALNVTLSRDYTWSQYVADKHRTMIDAALSETSEES